MLPPSRQDGLRPGCCTLLLMKGHPGSGKSTMAAALARATGWALLDKDDIKDFLVDVANGNGLAYDILWAMTGRLLGLGQSVIVDSPLSYPQSYATGRQLAARHRARLLVVETRPPDEVWRERLDARPAHVSRHKIADWAAMQTLLEEYDGCWQFPIDPAQHVVVDSSRPVDGAVDAVMARLTRDTTQHDTLRDTQ